MAVSLGTMTMGFRAPLASLTKFREAIAGGVEGGGEWREGPLRAETRSDVGAYFPRQQLSVRFKLVPEVLLLLLRNSFASKAKG